MPNYAGCNPQIVGDEKDKRIAKLEAEIKKLKEPWTYTEVYDEGYQAGFLDGQEKSKTEK